MPDLPAGFGADLPVGGDERRQDGDVVPGQELGHEGDPADVLVAVGLEKAEVAGQALADDIAVQALDPVGRSPSGSRPAVGDGRFARAGQPREPQRQADLFIFAH